MDYTALQMAMMIAVPVASLGAAWGGVKVGLSGTKERVKEIHTSFADHVKADESLQRELIDRTARIETKLDMLMEKK